MDERPDPDALLEQVKDQERRARRGKHTIFFGAAPGVGKTYAMLEAARAELERERRHVAVGVVETHGRYETAALVLGLPLLTQRKLEYRGVELSEFDLDEALRRRPELILMDELAHTNAEGSRHPKRWQDVEELLDAGIDVFSTMNVQHVESLNDVIAKITGVVVRETVPDSVLESAHDIKLVDLPPDDLLERLREGKVYVPAQAQRAIENFFRKGNLIALRELALRHTAERVDAQMRAYRHAHGIEQTWAAAEQLLVAVSPSPFSARLIRTGRRMASALHARWFAVFVEPPRARPLPERARTRLAQNLRLAEQLGAEVVTLSGENASDAILRFSRERNITKIVVGKPQTFRLRDRFRVSLVDQIVRNGGDIDVYVTAGDAAPDEAVPEKRARTRLEVPTFLAAGLISAACTALALLLFGRDQLPDVVMTYLLGIMVVSSRFGLGPSLFAALLSVALVDFFFVPPYFTFAVADFRHAVTFAVMFLVAVVISGLTQRIRNQVAAAREREQQTLGLYALSREVAAARGREQVLEVFARHIERAFASDVSILLPDRHGKLVRAYGRSARVADELERETAVSQWVWANQKEAGLHTNTLASNRTLYVPLLSSGGIMGVLGLTPGNEERFDGIEQRRQIDAFATQLALAVERAELSEQTEKARREFETEQLRSSLLSSVSHDLRTPLAVITGAASTLVEKPTLDDSARAELTKTILEEAERLNRLIRNLLDMTRLDSGTVKVKKDWQALEEVVGAALNRLEQRLAEREVRVELPRALPLVPFDSILIEQTLINLLENAIKYGQAPIEITASLRENGEAENRREIVVEIADHGPGLPEGEESRVFEKFHRAVRDGAASGAGLGLAICRAIVAAHGGRIWAQNRPEGGVSFRFTLPLEGAPPTLSLAEAPEASELRA